jgi:hypothetical protein
MRISTLIITVAAIAMSGCASTETVKEAKGQGVSRNYPYAYEQVYKATLSATKTKELEIIEEDKSKGRVILSHGITLWSWGERIAVFIKPFAASGTEVEIISKPVLAPLNFPPDWQHILLDQIDVQLKAGK